MYLGHRRFLPSRHPVRKKVKHFKGEADHWKKPDHRTGDHILDMVKDLKVIFGKGSGGQSVPNDADGTHTHVEEEIYILGPTLLERPRGPLCNRRDDEESLRESESARLLGRVWEDKRYTGGTGGPATYAWKRRHASKAVSRSCQLRSYQSREGNLL